MKMIKLSRNFVLAYGILCYLLHWLVTLYLIGFIGNMWWSSTVDAKPKYASAMWALSADLLLLCLFVALHWLMARPLFKRWWSHWVPQPIERSTYVLTTCLVLAILFWAW